MRRQIVLLLLIGGALAVLFFFGKNVTSEPDYTAFSTGPNGVSLFYDTLRKLQYPVSVGYLPVGDDSSVNDAQFIINPDNPVPDTESVNKMIDWVKRGGRLVYVDASYPTPFDTALAGYAQSQTGNLTRYAIGLGEVITGTSEELLNKNLMQSSLYGSLLAYIFDIWNADHIYFNEYYHGYRAGDNLFTRLPVVVKLAVYQLVLIAAAFAWHKGKRFGKPIPYYEETERGENEHVKALANLYYRTEKNKPRVARGRQNA